MNISIKKLLAASIFLLIQYDAFALPSPTPGSSVVGVKNTGETGQPDIASAMALPLPKANSVNGSVLQSLLDAQVGISFYQSGQGVSQGISGGGAIGANAIVLPASTNVFEKTSDGLTSQAYGTGNRPYTTSQVNAVGNTTTNYYPFRAAGKLFFKIGSSSYVCSASLIKKGVIVTAAHCVNNFNRSYYSNFQFAAGYNSNVAPYGLVGWKAAYVMSSYNQGTDSCYQRGVVCQNDVAVIVLSSNVGDTAGYYGYGYNGYSFVNNTAQITQLGYPVALDSGLIMERTDSLGSVSVPMSGNTLIGSLQTGGSSGGPWLVNLGTTPSVSGTSLGSASASNVVVGVTSWGYTDTGVKVQGASPFTSTNIVPLVNAACSAYPGSC